MKRRIAAAVVAVSVAFGSIAFATNEIGTRTFKFRGATYVIKVVDNHDNTVTTLTTKDSVLVSSVTCNLETWTCVSN